jgi:hypothetical protein
MSYHTIGTTVAAALPGSTISPTQALKAVASAAAKAKQLADAKLAAEKAAMLKAAQAAMAARAAAARAEKAREEAAKKAAADAIARAKIKAEAERTAGAKVFALTKEQLLAAQKMEDARERIQVTTKGPGSFVVNPTMPIKPTVPGTFTTKKEIEQGIVTPKKLAKVTSGEEADVDELEVNEDNGIVTVDKAAVPASGGGKGMLIGAVALGAGLLYLATRPRKNPRRTRRY